MFMVFAYVGIAALLLCGKTALAVGSLEPDAMLLSFLGSPIVS